MKISSKLLSIPPFISTQWKNILSIHMEDFETNTPIVVISLINGNRVVLPPLDPPIVEAIFVAHAQYMTDVSTRASQNRERSSITTQFFPPFPLSAFSLDNNPLKHNPSQIDMPDIPQEVVDQLSSIAKAMGIEDVSILPQSEPNCNCIHCQISRAIRNEKKEEPSAPEEEVTAEDLRFRNWDVTQTGEQLYLVTNPLDNKENYHVCLGESVGCTCGQKNCEHIKAVLST